MRDAPYKTGKEKSPAGAGLSSNSLDQAARMFAACCPLGPLTMSKLTR
jgi:hypothetical protein